MKSKQTKARRARLRRVLAPLPDLHRRIQLVLDGRDPDDLQPQIAEARALHWELRDSSDGDVVRAALRVLVDRGRAAPTFPVGAPAAANPRLLIDDDDLLGDRDCVATWQQLVYDPPDGRVIAHVDPDLLVAASSGRAQLDRHALIDEGLRSLIGRDASERLATMEGSAPDFRRAPRSAWHKRPEPLDPLHPADELRGTTEEGRASDHAHDAGEDAAATERLLDDLERAGVLAEPAVPQVADQQADREDEDPFDPS